jgi:hypothetical protein
MILGYILNQANPVLMIISYFDDYHLLGDGAVWLL